MDEASFDRVARDGVGARPVRTVGVVAGAETAVAVGVEHVHVRGALGVDVAEGSAVGVAGAVDRGPHHGR